MINDFYPNDRLRQIIEMLYGLSAQTLVESLVINEVTTKLENILKDREKETTYWYSKSAND